MDRGRSLLGLGEDSVSGLGDGRADGPDEVVVLEPGRGVVTVEPAQEGQ